MQKDWPRKTRKPIENAPHRLERLTPPFGDEVWSLVFNPKVFIFVPFGVFCGQSFELFRLERGGAQRRGVWFDIAGVKYAGLVLDRCL